MDNTPFFIGGTWGWSTDLRVEGEAEINLAVIAYCFDNPPAHTSTNDETAFTESSDNGLTFSIPKNISNNSGSSHYHKYLLLEIMSTLYGKIHLLIPEERV